MSDRTPFATLRSTVAVLPNVNVDTDQIIPARFLKTTDRDGLGRACFADWRYDADGGLRPEFPLNRPTVHGARILLAGHNFGCGSSREHAPWALLGFGFRAIISTRFADIFQGNALKNGLLPVTVTEDVHERLGQQVSRDPAELVTIDLGEQQISLPDGSTASFPIDAFAKHCLLAGVDELGYLVALDPEIAAYERAHAPRIGVTRA